MDGWMDGYSWINSSDSTQLKDFLKSHFQLELRVLIQGNQTCNQKF